MIYHNVRLYKTYLYTGFQPERISITCYEPMNHHLRVDHVYADARPTKYGTLSFESYEKFKVFSFDYMQVLSDDAFVGLTSYISKRRELRYPQTYEAIPSLVYT